MHRAQNNSVVQVVMENTCISFDGRVSVWLYDAMLLIDQQRDKAPAESVLQCKPQRKF